jgi:hypothetical protein
MRRRLLIIVLGIVVGVMAWLLEDQIRDLLVVPLLDVLWSARRWLLSIPQIVLWFLLVLVAALGVLPTIEWPTWRHGKAPWRQHQPGRIAEWTWLFAGVRENRHAQQPGGRHPCRRGAGATTGDPSAPGTETAGPSTGGSGIPDGEVAGRGSHVATPLARVAA